MKRVAVIGGGISGLSLVHRLFELSNRSAEPLEITLFEAANRLGGTIESEKREEFLLEKGPDSFISDKPWALDLCRKLGLESEIIGTRDENRKSFIVKDRKLLEVPQGFYLIAPTDIGAFLKSGLFSVGGKLRMMFEPFIPRHQNGRDESVGSFIRRRFGRECLDRVGQPMIGGIYTGDPERLSILATMPRFRQMEEKYGSIVRGLLANAKQKKGGFDKASGPRYSLFLSFRDGMETLTKKITEMIPQNSIRLRCGIKKITRMPASDQWKLSTVSGEDLTFDAVCSTVSSKLMARMIQDLDMTLYERLNRINFESVATINFAFNRKDIKHPLNGFGFVVPKTENSALVACSFSSQKFNNRAPEDAVLFRVFAGGVFGKKIFQVGDKELEELACRELRELLGIQAKPLFSSLSRYPDAMVQYELDHLELVSQIENNLNEHKGLFLTGSSYRGVGISDCVKDAGEQADKLKAFLDQK